MHSSSVGICFAILSSLDQQTCPGKCGQGFCGSVGGAGTLKSDISLFASSVFTGGKALPVEQEECDWVCVSGVCVWDGMHGCHQYTLLSSRVCAVSVCVLVRTVTHTCLSVFSYSRQLSLMAVSNHQFIILTSPHVNSLSFSLSAACFIHVFLLFIFPHTFSFFLFKEYPDF